MRICKLISLFRAFTSTQMKDHSACIPGHGGDGLQAGHVMRSARYGQLGQFCSSGETPDTRRP